MSFWRDPDLAIDMGSDRTRLLVGGVVRVETPTRDPATGRAVVDKGVVADPDAAARLAARLIRPRHLLWRRRARVVASCPLHVSGARSLLVEALRSAGAGEVDVIRSTVAAAAGAGLDVTGRYAGLLVDVGAALTEVAVFRDGAVIHAATIAAGTRDLARVTAPSLAGGVARFWDTLPLDVQVQTIESGLVLTGGGAEMASVVHAMRQATRLDVRVPPRPRQAVVRGLAQLARRPAS